MTPRADRRSVLAGLTALGLAGCDRAPESDHHSRSPRVIRDIAVDLSALEARHGGRIGLFANGKAGQAVWRGDERFLYCSTFKTFLAAATLARVTRGEERRDRAISITRADMLSHAPVTEPAVGSTLTIVQLCDAAIQQSDNPAANILIRELGGLDAFRAWYRSIGDETTRVDRMEMELNRPDGDKDTTTARQTVRNLSAILTGQLAYPEYMAWYLAMKSSVPGPWRIKAGVPAGANVGHKTGTGGSGPTNDIGFVELGAETVNIAVYYDATPASTSAQRDAVIADATRLALKALGHD